MEKTIKDVLSDFKDRLTNPFTSSFILAWLVNNYPITIGLIFYKQSELKKDGYGSFIDLINKHASWWHMLILPIAASLIYTFGFPWFKYLIHWYRGWIDVLDTNNLKTVQGKEIILKEKYVELHNLYSDKLNIAADLTEEKLRNYDEINKQNESIIDLKKELYNSKKQIEQFVMNNDRKSALSNAYWISGKYAVDYHSPVLSRESKFGTEWILTRDSVTILGTLYKYEGFTVNPENNNLVFFVPDLKVNDGSKIDQLFSFKFNDKNLLTLTSNSASIGLTLRRNEE
ncbi:hypothetical protein [Pedobacter jeongneungensis]|uniref:hypothetical protein n=1 Tax=Pedobacter jeongneungensis TaxID=947309 RepID=UPI0013B3A322|nr:hypothetical protein [Pedobacter jeongneungensis]